MTRSLHSTPLTSFLGMTDTHTEIATCRLNQPRGQLIEKLGLLVNWLYYEKLDTFWNILHSHLSILSSLSLQSQMPLGRPKHAPRSPLLESSESPKVQKSTKKYSKVLKSTKSTPQYPKVPKSTKKLTKVPKSIQKYTKEIKITQKYRKVTTSIQKYPKVFKSIQK